MRFLAVVVASVSTMFAQHVPVINSGPALRPPPGAYRFGNILFPGGIAPHQQTHAGRMGGVISGVPPFGGVTPGAGPRFPHRNRTIVVPYAVPVYYGDPYGYGYAQQQSPNVTVVMPQQPAPSVVINHHYTPETAAPAMREYSSGELPESGGVRVYEAPRTNQSPKEDAVKRQAFPRSEASDKPTIFLIALKDSTIRQAIGYWIEDDTLQFVTPQGKITHITLDNLDKDLSEQLNKERNLDFDLNSARRSR
jgi:hypothetical protein